MRISGFLGGKKRLSESEKFLQLSLGGLCTEYIFPLFEACIFNPNLVARNLLEVIFLVVDYHLHKTQFIQLRQ